MTLTHKLLGYLHRAFRRDPVEFLALRLRYDGLMTWKVEDCVLTTSVSGGSGSALSVDLNLYSIAELANFLSTQAGYSVAYQVATEASVLGARILLDGSGDQDSSNGDHLYAFTSLTWAFLDTSAVELKAAREQIYQMLRQMTTVTAEGAWLDEIGGYYGVPRANGELDSVYGPRIVYEVIRPRNNNKALELAISIATGGLPSKVIDVTVNGSMTPLYDGVIDHNGAYFYNATGSRIRNLFDVEYAFDLEGSEDTAPFRARVLELIDRFRSAGTHLRSVLLTAGTLSDTVTSTPADTTAYTATVTATEIVPLPSDASLSSAGTLTFTESATGPAEGEEVVATLSSHLYNGSRYYGGSGRQVYHDSGIPNISLAPSLSLVFDEGTMPGGLTFTRASTGTYFDSTGMLQVAGVNAPRIDYNPATGECLGLLVEEARTNIIFPSDGTGAIANGIGATFSPIVVPSGATVSCLWTPGDLSNRYQYTTTAGAYASGQLLAVSWYQKRVNGAGSGACLDLRSNVNCAISTAVAKIGDAPNGWERWGGVVSITDGSLSSIIRLYVFPADMVAGGFAAWGLQVENGPSASSYIPTTSAAVPRSADVCSVAVGAWHNPLECTVVAEGEGRVGVTNTSSFVSVGTSSNYQVLLRQNASIVQGDSRDASTGQAAFSRAGNQGDRVVLGMAVQQNSFAFSSNGSAPATDSAGTVFSGSTALHVGSFAGASSFLNGRVRSIRYWNRRLGNEVLALATS
jgi:hypothetical protein